MKPLLCTKLLSLQLLTMQSSIKSDYLCFKLRIRCRPAFNILVVVILIFVICNRFGGENFSFSRMSWIKTNFLWMMYRCGWASKHGQERVLAVRILRKGFDEILSKAYSAQVRYAPIFLSKKSYKYINSH